MVDRHILPKPRRFARANAQQTENSCTSYTRYMDREGERWTPVLVEERLRKAVALQAAVNIDRVVVEIVTGRSPGNGGIIGGIGGAGTVGRDEDGLVTHASEALAWLRWLDPDDAAILRTRLSGAPWKSICWRFGISRPTADRRYRYGLRIISWRLNGHRAGDPKPSLRSLLGMR